MITLDNVQCNVSSTKEIVPVAVVAATCCTRVHPRVVEFLSLPEGTTARVTNSREKCNFRAEVVKKSLRREGRTEDSRGFVTDFRKPALLS